MCIICKDLDNLTTLEAIRNLSEMVEGVGKDHAKEVLETIALRETDQINKDETNVSDSLQAIEIAIGMLPQLLDEDEMPGLEEIKEMTVAVKEELIKLSEEEDLIKEVQTK